MPPSKLPAAAVQYPGENTRHLGYRGHACLCANAADTECDRAPEGRLIQNG